MKGRRPSRDRPCGPFCLRTSSTVANEPDDPYSAPSGFGTLLRSRAVLRERTDEGCHLAHTLITGITGQDGQFLAELLHDKGYEVFGLLKGQNNPKAELINAELPFVELVSGDLQDLPAWCRRSSRPSPTRSTTSAPSRSWP